MLHESMCACNESFLGAAAGRKVTKYSGLALIEKFLSDIACKATDDNGSRLFAYHVLMHAQDRGNDLR